MEYFWVVDEEDRVIGKETRVKCHKSRLIHRSVYIFLVNSKKEVFIQKRSMAKDLYPGYYTGSATGHVNYGETYDQAALRELDEELGIKAPLKRLGKFKSFSHVEKEISTLYLCRYDGEIKFNRKEISKGLFMSLRQVESDMESGEKRFALGFKLAFNMYKSYLKEAKWS
jgi:isopentenyl-diphosphate delta-isomerase type 1